MSPQNHQKCDLMFTLPKSDILHFNQSQVQNRHKGHRTKCQMTFPHVLRKENTWGTPPKVHKSTDTSSELIDATLYRQIIGSLMYLTNTKPDICFAVNTLSQFLAEPRHVHLVAAKHVMRYLKGTLDCGLNYDEDHDFTLSGYTDSDWAGSVFDRKSTLGCCFSLESAMISW
jgi:hypothetical protein